MFDLLFCDLPVITMQEDAPVMEHAYVGIRGKKIAYVGTVRPTEQSARVIDGTYKLMMPGLVNTHAHTAMCLMRGYADDYPLQQWLYERVFPVEGRLDERAVLAGAALGYAESIAAGITSTTDMYFFMPATLELACTAGIRTNFCNPLMSFDPKGFCFEKDRGVMETRLALKELHGAEDGRIQVDMGIHAEYTSFPAAWDLAAGFAKEHGLNMQVHLSETRSEHEECIARWGKTPAEVLAEHGVFDQRTTAAHCVWLSKNDMQLLAKKGVSAAHNPISNLKLGSGIAQVEKMLETGVNVTLGSDGCCSNNTLDFFEEMKFAALLQKGSALDPAKGSAISVLKMATVNGAKAQGREGIVGRIQEGYEADLILLDMDKPHLSPCYDPVGSAVYCAHASDVCLTMVQGRILYENGSYKTLDVDKILSEARGYGVDKVLDRGTLC